MYLRMRGNRFRTRRLSDRTFRELLLEGNILLVYMHV